jgi:F-type H+-transporting ATPase subunit gamma
LANTQALRRRIRSVRSTQQITKAMKMVAASRFRRAQERLLEARPYGEALEGVLRSLAARVGPQSHPLLAERAERSITLVVVTSDKGLCGTFNSNILRAAATMLAERRWEHVDLVLVGRKAIDFFKFRGITPLLTFPDLMSAMKPERAFGLARSLAQRFADRETDAVYGLFNRFRSVIQQQVSLERLLPIERADLPGDARLAGYIFEPGPAAILKDLVPRFVEFQVLRALLSSLAAEHAARMTAMDGASKNAAEMIDHLTLTYNRQRQATITKELIEIVSGAEALAGR